MLALVAACTAAPDVAPPRIASAGADPVPLLQQLIRVDTRNPGGKTLPVAQLLQREFEAVGAQTEIIATPTAGVVHFIARIDGSDEQPPVLLAAHSDVVPFDPEQWSVEPLGAQVKDGWVYGRGAMDFKGGLAVFATAVLRIAKEQLPLDRDVILLAEAEEEGGRYNTEWLARQHWDKINAGVALNEGGWILEGPGGKPAQVTISTADKIYAVLALRTTATSTHASRPLPDSAIVRLNAAIAKLGGYDTPVTLNAQTHEYFTTLAEHSAPPLSDAARRLVSAATQQERDQAGQDVVRFSGYQPLHHALMRNTLAYTVQRAGEKDNVIPGSAEARINVRLVPGGSTPFDVAEQVRAVIADPKVTVTVQPPPGRPEMTEQQIRDFYEAAARRQPSPTDTDLYDALVDQARAQWPTAAVAPGLFEAGTDATAWRSRGVPVYGIYPYPLDNDTLERMHGNDERIKVSSLEEGAEMIYRTLKQVAGR
ncbi:MAG: M20/M25/M40 family metallo-hydrolase [Egibacteraceae bacterium]